MTESLGLIKIGELEFPEIFAGDFPRVTEDVRAAYNLKRGAALQLTGGAVGLVSGSSDVYGILAEDLEAGEIGVAYLTGEFVGARCEFGSGTWRDWTKNARKVLIFFKEASLATYEPPPPKPILGLLTEGGLSLTTETGKILTTR